jgi:hypothetical protein
MHCSSVSPIRPEAAVATSKKTEINPLVPRVVLSGISHRDLSDNPEMETG